MEQGRETGEIEGTLGRKSLLVRSPLGTSHQMRVKSSSSVNICCDICLWRWYSFAMEILQKEY